MSQKPPFLMSSWEKHYQSSFHNSPQNRFPPPPVTSYTKPRLIGFYESSRPDSTQDQHQHLPFPFKFPKQHTNLSEGFSNKLHEKKQKDHSPENLKKSYLSLVSTILRRIQEGAIDSIPHVVTFRNNLNKIMASPFQKRNNWEIVVQKVGETLFLHMVIDQDETIREEHKKFMYCGYMFETECLDVCMEAGKSQEGSDSTKNQKQEPLPDSQKESTEIGEVGSTMIVTSTLNHRMQLAIGAEVDAMDTNGVLPHIPQSTPHGNYTEMDRIQSLLVELKTNKIFKRPKDEFNFGRFKAMRMWIQSYLVGLQHLVVGFHDDGILKQVLHYEVAQLPSLSRGFWWGPKCLQFTHDLLSWIGKTVTEGNTVRLCFHSEVGRIDVKEEPDSLLPADFVDEWKKTAAEKMPKRNLKRPMPDDQPQRTTKRPRK